MKTTNPDVVRGLIKDAKQRVAKLKKICDGKCPFNCRPGRQTTGKCDETCSILGQIRDWQKDVEDWIQKLEECLNKK